MTNAKAALTEAVVCAVLRDDVILYQVSGKGLKPLWTLCAEHGDELHGAMVADKVIGRAAASLLMVHGVSHVYGALMSQGAYEWLTAYGIAVAYGKLTPAIQNRDGTGLCPMEQLVANAATPKAAVALLRERLGN